ncbi:hypothetical protein [Acidovorax sp. SRB_24]|uniref:hypothetical protein n=1 Tax=Acidovorax sp. SRB_24 TaxID=1962700 RepID=UPI00145F8A1C|nr:hypothetical protein [Acidovorax sp. SRB_24]NMM77633.1 hypothetical protein [Acidovorax sp. SRB_24]
MKKLIAIAIASIGLAGLAACDVKKTQEGNVTLPKYEVEKTQSGDVTLPKYDVKTPDVHVTTEEKTITVPKVEVTPAK